MVVVIWSCTQLSLLLFLQGETSHAGNRVVVLLLLWPRGKKKKLHIALSHGRRLLLLQYVLVVVKGGSCWLIWFSRSCCRIAALSMTWPGRRRRNSERLKGSSTTSTTRSSLLFDKAMTVSQQSTKYTFLRQFAVVQLLHEFLQPFQFGKLFVKTEEQT